MSEDTFGTSVQDLTLRATLLGKIAAWNELAKWMMDTDVTTIGVGSTRSEYYPKSMLVDLIVEKTDALNAEFTGEDSE